MFFNMGAKSISRVLALGFLWALAAAPGAQAFDLTLRPLNSLGAHAVTPTPNGASVLVGSRQCGAVNRFDTAAHTFTPVLSTGLPCSTFGLPEPAIFSSVLGPDGKLYFTLYDPDPADGNGAVGRVNLDGTGFESRVVGQHPADITVGPDGNVWFTENGPPGRVVRVDPADFFNPDPFNVPGSVQGPRGIVDGGDGNLYVLGGESGKVWRMTTAATPAFTEVGTGLAGPSFGELGPDGKIWFTLFEGDAVAKVDVAAGTVGGQVAVAGNPWDVAFGPDGKAYVTRFNASAVTQLSGSTAVGMPLPAGERPVFIEASADGNLYAAVRLNGGLLEITPDVAPVLGTVSESGVGDQTATVDAVVDPRGTVTNVSVEYGPAAAYGTVTPIVGAGDGIEARDVSVPLSGLDPGTLYHYRVVATNAHGTTRSADGTFTTTDGDPPETELTKKPKKKSSDKTPTVKAKSDEASSTFQCKLDKEPFQDCKPKTTYKVKPGKHKIQVAAVDQAGNVDPTPAKARFKVKRKKR
jgi:streptogramin lyase